MTRGRANYNENTGVVKGGVQVHTDLDNPGKNGKWRRASSAWHEHRHRDREEGR